MLFFLTGVGGNLVAIQTSRISTYLHMWSTPGVLPIWMKKFWPNPCSTFCSSGVAISIPPTQGHFLQFSVDDHISTAVLCLLNHTQV